MSPGRDDTHPISSSGRAETRTTPFEWIKDNKIPAGVLLTALALAVSIGSTLFAGWEHSQTQLREFARELAEAERLRTILATNVAQLERDNDRIRIEIERNRTATIENRENAKHADDERFQGLERRVYNLEMGCPQPAIKPPARDKRG